MTTQPPHPRRPIIHDIFKVTTAPPTQGHFVGYEGLPYDWYLRLVGDGKDHVDLATWGLPTQAVAPAGGYRSPAIDKTNFLVEAYFRTEPGRTGGILLQKKDRAGYALAVDPRGGLTFQVGGESESAAVQTRGKLNDGAWHQVVAEADRKAEKPRLYVDGHRDAETNGIGPVSLANQEDLYVGDRPDGGHLAGTIEFMRIAQGIMDDATTTIEESYAWQFSGPFLDDFLGHRPRRPPRRWRPPTCRSELKQSSFRESVSCGNCRPACRTRQHRRPGLQGCRRRRCLGLCCRQGNEGCGSRRGPKQAGVADDADWLGARRP